VIPLGRTTKFGPGAPLLVTFLYQHQISLHLHFQDGGWAFRQLPANGKSGMKMRTSVPEVRDYTKDLAMGVISEAGFGVKIDHLYELIDENSKEMNFKQALTMAIAALPQKSLFSDYLFKTICKKSLRAYSYLEESLNSQMENAKLRKERGESTHNDILSLLTTAKEDGMVLTAQEIIADSFIFYLAGHETTATTLAYAARLLAENPQVQNKMVEEMKELGDEFDYNMYSKLTYSKCVVKETLRIYSPTSVIPKYSFAETTLGGVPIPNHSVIMISTYALHRNPKYWDKPDEFIPERFDSRVSPPIHPYAFVPFSSGPRTCIGNKFALVEASIALALLVKNYIFELAPGDKPGLLELESMMTVKPSKPIHVTLKKRN